MSSRSPYTGTERRLVFAFDVGTTFSGISYAILDPGREPQIRPVTRFPGTSKVGGDAKVPTVVYYGPDGSVRAIGAETEREGLEAIAADSHWSKAECYGAYPSISQLRTEAKECGEDIPSLPVGKSAVDILVDLLRYLNHCARSYIEERHNEGTSVLSSGRVHYILSHPNAWEGAQQTLMRQAAVRAGLITDAPEDREQIDFATEGEASLNFCIDHGLMNQSIQSGDGVIIVDAGGGTIDVSSYARKGSMYDFEEIAASQSYFRGSVFVTRAAQKYFNDFFLDTRFYDDVSSITKLFDRTTKIQFRGPDDPCYIKFGSARDRDPALSIRGGQLKLEGTLVADFFEPSVQSIIDATIAQRDAASKPVSTVFLVGGFASSDYLFTQLQQRLKAHGLDVFRSDAPLNKAVPDGAVSGYLRPTIRARIAKYCYGIRCNAHFDESDPAHVERRSQTFYNLRGWLLIRGGFENILSKNTQVEQTQEFRQSFSREARSKRKLTTISTPIVCYRGHSSCPLKFIDGDEGNFYDILKIHGDLSNVVKNMKRKIGRNGTRYYDVDFDIIIQFGLTEFKAQIAWIENGVEKRWAYDLTDFQGHILNFESFRSPAEVIFDTDIEYEV